MTTRAVVALTVFLGGVAVALAVLFVQGRRLIGERLAQAAARAGTAEVQASGSAAAAPLARSSDLSLYRRLYDQARPYRLHVVGVFLLSLLASPLALLTPYPLKLAVDSVLGNHPVPEVFDALLPAAATSSRTAILLVATGLVILTALLSQVQTLATSLLSTYTGERLVLNFRARLFRHVQRLSVSYHDEKGTSDSTYRLQYDAQAIQYVAIYGLIPFVTAGVTLVTMLYVILRVDWQLGLIALAISPILFMISRIYRRRLRRQSSEAKALESSALSVAQEALGALRVVKAFGQEDREQERFVQRSSLGMRARIRLAFLESAFGLFVGLTTALGTGAVLFIGIRHVQSRVLTLGSLLLIMGYLTQLYAPLKTMSKRVADLQSWLASAERAFSLLDEVQDVPEGPDARPLAHRAAGALAFRNVSFAYMDGHPVLRNLSLDINPHMRLGIAGLTGSGKTTLVSLLMRFYDPTAGQVLLDGLDLREYKLADLRNQFALVLQEPVLFSASIAENIAYARPDASAEEIIEAAKAASAHEFITRLPDGYDTQVGERGMRLSGGERQRLSLARAFLKDAPILILDEPTSSVDAKTEAMILEALERLMHDRTTVMISHRESTLQPCDMRIELSRGEGMSWPDVGDVAIRHDGQRADDSRFPVVTKGYDREAVDRRLAELRIEITDARRRAAMAAAALARVQGEPFDQQGRSSGPADTIASSPEDPLYARDAADFLTREARARADAMLAAATTRAAEAAAAADRRATRNLDAATERAERMSAEAAERRAAAEEAAAALRDRAAEDVSAVLTEASERVDEVWDRARRDQADLQVELQRLRRLRDELRDGLAEASAELRAVGGALEGHGGGDSPSAGGGERRGSEAAHEDQNHDEEQNHERDGDGAPGRRGGSLADVVRAGRAEAQP